MRVQSVVRQNLVSALLTGSGVIMGGLIIVFVGGSDLVSGPNPIVIGLGVLMVVIGGAAVVATALSVTLVAELDPQGVTSRERGASWTFGWRQVQQVWIVWHKGLAYLAVLPTPEAAGARHRTVWRSRQLHLADEVRTVRLDPAALPAVAGAVEAHWGRQPQQLEH